MKTLLVSMSLVVLMMGSGLETKANEEVASISPHSNNCMCLEPVF